MPELALASPCTSVLPLTNMPQQKKFTVILKDRLNPFILAGVEAEETGGKLIIKDENGETVGSCNLTEVQAWGQSALQLTQPPK